jgi:hypothetical protein
VIVRINFEAKRGEVIVIRRKQVIRGRKKKKIPRVEFDMEAIKEIKKQRKRSQKGN